MAQVEMDRGNYLTTDDVNDLDLLPIVGEAIEVESQYGTRLHLPVKTRRGENKIFSLNKTSKNNLISAYGKETTAWIGKKVLIKVFSQNVRGAVKDVIYGHPEGEIRGKLQEATDEKVDKVPF